MLRSNLYDYADSCILVKSTITITGARDDAGERDKRVIFKSCAPFTKCISRINNTDIDNAHDIDILMLMYNLMYTVIIFQNPLEVYDSTTKMILIII